MTDRQKRLFYVLFSLSGFTGLIYESIWTHYLKLFLGHAAYAQALVLAIFMGGLALGSWICSAYTETWRDPLQGYAVLEAIIGILALIFHTVFDQATQYSYSHIIPNLGPGVAITLFKWGLSSLLILPQAVLLGMTFPLMTAGFVRLFPVDAGRSISTLYFTNSIGAAFGVLASGFWLIGLLGLPGTIRAAGLINLGVAAWIWILIRQQRAGVPDSGVSGDRKKVPQDKWYGILLIASLITGIASFIYEIAWIRMLSLVLGSATHAFELMLSAFIFGLAFGGLWIRYRIRHIADPIRYLIVVQVVMGVMALSTLILYGNVFGAMQWLMRTLPRTDTGYLLFNLGSWLISVVIMLPATFCAGMTLPLITHALLTRGCGERSIGAVYAANTLGAIIGIFFAIHFAMPVLGLKGLLLTGAGLDMLLGVVLLWGISASSRSLRIPAIMTASCVVVLVFCGWFVELDSYKMGSGVYRTGDFYSPETVKLLFYEDGKTASVSVFLIDSGLSIRTNGKPDAMIETDPSKPWGGDMVTAISAALFPLLFRSQADVVANIGFGSGLTTATLLRSETIKEVHTIEIEPAMVEGARTFGKIVEAAYSDPRSMIHLDDAKAFFSAQNRKYDVIISEPSNPWVSGVAGLYSREFYRTITRHLSANGVFCQWLQLYEIDTNLVVSILKALSPEFTDFAVYSAHDYDVIIIAKNGGMLDDPDPILFKNPRIVDALENIGISDVDAITFRKVADKPLLRAFLESHPARENSDYYPVLDQNAVRTRFLNSHADDLITITFKPLPLSEMLMRHPITGTMTNIGITPEFTRSQDAVRAMALRDYFNDGSFSEKYPDLPREVKDSTVQLRNLFYRFCDASSEERVAGIYQTIAFQMTPYLRPAELDKLWKRLDTGACVRSFPERDRQWILLFKAVGQRNGLAMAEAAQVILEKERELPAGPMSYVVASGMLGNLAQGNKDAALELWNDHGIRIFGSSEPTLLFQLLLSLSTAP